MKTRYLTCQDESIYLARQGARSRRRRNQFGRMLADFGRSIRIAVRGIPVSGHRAPEGLAFGRTTA